MKELELFDICGYLPYGMMAESNHGIIIIEGYKPFMSNNDEKIGELLYTRAKNIKYGSFASTLNDITPILRPISDLYKPIIHDSKEEIPLMECLKICFEHTRVTFEKKHKQIRFNRSGRIFKYGSCGFEIRNRDNSQRVSVHNQYKLFDYLNSRFIDYRGLIDAGLAVSVYDLKNNPYK